MDVNNLIAVDVGGSKIRVGSVNNIYTPQYIEATKKNSVLLQLKELINRVIISQQMIEPLVIVGFPGYISKFGYLHQSYNLQLKDINIKKNLEESIPAHFIVINDSKLQGLSYLNQYNTSFYCVFGTGVGGVLISNGSIITGYNGLAGELGHMYLQGCKLKCICGRTGCLEASLSGRALISRFGNNWWLRQSDEISAYFVKYGRKLGILTDSICQLLNPEVFIYNGKIFQYNIFRDSIVATYHKFSANFSKLLFVYDNWPLVIQGSINIANAYYSQQLESIFNLIEQ